MNRTTAKNLHGKHTVTAGNHDITIADTIEMDKTAMDITVMDITVMDIAIMDITVVTLPS